LALQPAREARDHLKATSKLDAPPASPVTARRAAAAAAAPATPSQPPLQVVVRIEDLALLVPISSRCGFKRIGLGYRI
jgi:hypothetical protein